jgi:hypothetical protein
MVLDALGGMYTGRPGRGFDMQTAGRNVPYPQFDRSKAITTTLIPEQVWKIMDPTVGPTEALGGSASQALGYGFSAAFNMYKAIFNQHLAPSDMKRWEGAMPRFMGSWSKAYRALTEGRERVGGPAGGSTVTKYDWRDPEQLMEIIGLAAGYNDLRRANKWDKIMGEKEHEKYIEMTRKGLMETFHEVLKAGDPIEVDKAKAKIVEFNGGLSDMDRGMAIKPSQLMESFKARERTRVERETGIPRQKGKRPIAGAYGEIYPETIELLHR